MLRLKDIREKQNKKQQECADAVGITLRAWQSYEQGVREPKYNLLCEIADYFGVTTDYLLGRDDPVGQPDPIEELISQYNLDPLERSILEGYMALPDKARANVMDFLKRTVAEKNKNKHGGE